MTTLEIPEEMKKQFEEEKRHHKRTGYEDFEDTGGTIKILSETANQMQDVLNRSEQLKGTTQLAEIFKKPKQGKIYIYHQGFLTKDIMRKDNVGKKIRSIAADIRYKATRGECMIFQKKMSEDFYIYFFVR